MKDRQVYWKVRKAFCASVCPNGCQQLKDDIEGGGGIVVNCDKLKKFVKVINEVL